MRRVPPYLLAVAVMLAAAGMAWHFRIFYVDDAFISFRYAENLSGGHSLVFNPGEYVEGYSNLLWTLLLAALHALGAPTPQAAKLLGALCAVLGVGLLLFLKPGRLSLPAAVLLALALPWAVWAVSGMETASYSLLVLLTAFAMLRLERGPRWSALAATAGALAVLSRPEGLLLVLALAAAASLDQRALPRRALTVVTLAPCLAWLAQTAFRLAYYGDWLPNTYYAKSGPLLWSLSRGAERYAGFFLERGAWALLFLPVLFGLRSRRPAGLAAALVVIAQTAFFLKVGGDWMGFHRFFVPMLPFLFLLWQEGAEWLTGRLPRLRHAALALLVVLMALGGWLSPRDTGERLWSFAERYTSGYTEGLVRTGVELGRYLRQVAPPGATIALGDIGALPYYSGLRVVDLYGLANRQLAHLPGHAQYFDEAEFDVGEMLAARPEFIALNSANDFRRRCELFRPVRHLKIDGMIYARPEFQTGWVWLRGEPFAEGYWTHLFVRADLYPTLRARVERN